MSPDQLELWVTVFGWLLATAGLVLLVKRQHG